MVTGMNFSWPANFDTLACGKLTQILVQHLYLISITLKFSTKLALGYFFPFSVELGIHSTSWYI